MAPRAAVAHFVVVNGYAPFRIAAIIGRLTGDAATRHLATSSASSSCTCPTRSTWSCARSVLLVMVVVMVLLMLMLMLIAAGAARLMCGRFIAAGVVNVRR